MPSTRPEPTRYAPASLEICPTLAARYLPTYPYRVVHWYAPRPGGRSTAAATLGHYRTRAAAERALTRLSRPA